MLNIEKGVKMLGIEMNLRQLLVIKMVTTKLVS